MDHKIQKTLEAGLRAYADNAKLDVSGLSNRLIDIFNGDNAYLEKVAQMDAAFDDHPSVEELRETVFDLLLLNFFAADVEKLEGDYLESPEWETIEEQTIDRGTELLNLLLYLRECADEDIEPQLEDYLKEFLLVDEDEFQDEYRIYEHVIANQTLSESSYAEIAEAASKVPEDQELGELFYPLMSFFQESGPSDADMSEYGAHSRNQAFDVAVYTLVVEYNR